VNEFRGILPALITPFDDEGKFLAERIEKLLERLYTAGVHGVYVCGQTGEGLLQTDPQRKAVTEAAVRCSPRGKKVIVHVAANRTEDAVELARHASHVGVDAVSALPPIGGYSFAEVKAYYEALAHVSRWRDSAQRSSTFAVLDSAGRGPAAACIAGRSVARQRRPISTVVRRQSVPQPRSDSHAPCRQSGPAGTWECADGQGALTSTARTSGLPDGATARASPVARRGGAVASR
jgi:hypothetical protein